MGGPRETGALCTQALPSGILCSWMGRKALTWSPGSAGEGCPFAPGSQGSLCEQRQSGAKHPNGRACRPVTSKEHHAVSVCPCGQHGAPRVPSPRLPLAQAPGGECAGFRQGQGGWPLPRDIFLSPHIASPHSHPHQGPDPSDPLTRLGPRLRPSQESARGSLPTPGSSSKRFQQNEVKPGLPPPRPPGPRAFPNSKEPLLLATQSWRPASPTVSTLPQ